MSQMITVVAVIACVPLILFCVPVVRAMLGHIRRQ